MTAANNARAVFLDRDGTLMEDVNYVGEVERVVVLPGVGPALRQLRAAGFKLLVVTNQSGVARGYFSREAVEQIHGHLNEEFARWGVSLDRYYVCPHHPEENCDCRKPRPRFLQEAAREYGLDLARSYMVGDRASDLEAGRNAGVRTILVLTGVGRATLAQPGLRADHVAADLAAAAAWIVQQ